MPRRNLAVLSIARFVLPLLLIGYPASSAWAAFDSLGTSVTFTPFTSCSSVDNGGLNGGNCYQADIYGCAGEQDGSTPFTARVKVNEAVGQFKGVIFFIAGGG